MLSRRVERPVVWQHRFFLFHLLGGPLTWHTMGRITPIYIYPIKIKTGGYQGAVAHSQPSLYPQDDKILWNCMWHMGRVYTLKGLDLTQISGTMADTSTTPSERGEMF